jgi:hypothetical protein
MTRPPIVGAPLWAAVMKNADNCCECQGVCGKKHTDPATRKPGRCDHRNGQRIAKYGEVILIATPRDPVNEGSFAVAAQLPARRLIALCPPCYDGVRRIFKRAVKQMDAQPDGLFDADPYLETGSKKQADVGAA